MKNKESFESKVLKQKQHCVAVAVAESKVHANFAKQRIQFCLRQSNLLVSRIGFTLSVEPTMLFCSLWCAFSAKISVTNFVFDILVYAII